MKYFFKGNNNMKYFKRLKIYKASNVIFNPETFEAHSYRWWRFVQRINGKIVFNNYSYSNSTRKHQNKVWSLLRQLGIKVDLVVNISTSLCEYSGKDALRSAYHSQDFDRVKQIEEVFQVKLTDEEIEEVYVAKEEALCDDMFRRALKYQEKKHEREMRNYDKTFSKKANVFINEETLTNNQGVQ